MYYTAKWGLQKIIVCRELKGKKTHENGFDAYTRYHGTPD